MVNYKYSVIIPHRNLPELLCVCLDSIPHRNDVQIVIVDDNSDSDIVDFSHFPGYDRDNVEIILTKEGRGAGYARNVGIEKAKGEWLLFADSDDHFDSVELDTFLNFSFDEYEVVAWAYRWIKNNEILERHYTNSDKESLFKMKEPWKKMVKKDFLVKNAIDFQESKVANDLLYSMKVAYNCKKYYYYDKVLYNWVLRTDSLSASYSGSKLKEAYSVVMNSNKYLKSIGKNEYYDRSHFYLSLIWDESKLRYYYSLLKYAITVGVNEALQNNEIVCRQKCISPNPIIAIMDYFRVKIGGLRRRN